MRENEAPNGFLIEPFSLLRDVVLNLWLVILAALIGLMAVSIWNRSAYIPQYTSSAVLIANINQSSVYTYTNLSSASELAETYTEVFRTNALQKKAAAYLGRESFSGKVESEKLTNTNVFTVSVTTHSPMTSYEEMCAVLKVYPEIADTIFEGTVVEVMREPSLPVSPSNQISRKYQAAAAAGCAALVLALIVLLSITRETVKDDRIFKRDVDAKLFGSVQHESRHRTIRSFVKDFLHPQKTSLLVGKTVTSFAFAENYHKIATKIEYLHHSEGSRVFLVTSCAENEGKSTTSANIALTLAGRGSRVLLLDMDFIKPAVHKVFDVNETDSADFADLLSGKITPAEYRPHALKGTKVGLAVNRHSHPDYVDWIHSDYARKMMKGICGSNRYDFVIIDTPPISAAADVTEMISFADRSLLVVRADFVRIRNVNDAILDIRSAQDNLEGCILNDVPGDFNRLLRMSFVR